MPTSLRAALAAATMAPKDKDDDPREDKDFRRALRGKFRNVHKTVHGASPALGPARPTRSPPASNLLKGHHHPTDLVARFSPQNPRMNSSTSPATTS